MNVLAPNLCVVSCSRLDGRLMIWMASNGHFFTQMPHPMQSVSLMSAVFECVSTSMHSFPVRTTGQLLLHSWRHLFGLHLSALTIAMRVKRSCVSCFDAGFPPPAAMPTSHFSQTTSYPTSTGCTHWRQRLLGATMCGQESPADRRSFDVLDVCLLFAQPEMKYIVPVLFREMTMAVSCMGEEPRIGVFCARRL